MENLNNSLVSYEDVDFYINQMSKDLFNCQSSKDLLATLSSNYLVVNNRVGTEQ